MKNILSNALMVVSTLLIAAQFALADDRIFDVTIKEINPNWCNASVLTGTPKNNRSYSISGKFYGIETITVSVGSYTTCDNKQGTFLLALNTSAENDGVQSNIKRKISAFQKVKVLQEFDKVFKPTLMKFQGNAFLFFDCDDCKEANLYKISGYPHKFVVEEKLDEKQVADGTINPYFVDCQDALKLSEFSALKRYFEKSDDWNPNRTPDSCFRMNKYEYVILDSNTRGGIVYWNEKTNETSSDLNPPYIGVQREMTGRAGKRFVLMRTGYAIRGESGSEYLIFHLVPKTSDKHSYELEKLIGSHENPVSGLCGDWNNVNSGNLYQPGLSAIKKATSINSYKILNDGTADLKISFDITEQDCKSLEKTHLVKTFDIGNERFNDAQ